MLAPTFSHIGVKLLIEEIRCAKMALETILLSSLENMLVVIMRSFGTQFWYSWLSCSIYFEYFCAPPMITLSGSSIFVTALPRCNHFFSYQQVYTKAFHEPEGQTKKKKDQHKKCMCAFMTKANIKKSKRSSPFPTSLSRSAGGGACAFTFCHEFWVGQDNKFVLVGFINGLVVDQNLRNKRAGVDWNSGFLHDDNLLGHFDVLEVVGNNSGQIFDVLQIQLLICTLSVGFRGSVDGYEYDVNAVKSLPQIVREK